MEAPSWCPDQGHQGGDGDTQSFPHGSLLLGQMTMNATVEMTTKVDNRDFTEELKNPSSPAYKSFEKEFQEKVRAQPCNG